MNEAAPQGVVGGGRGSRGPSGGEARGASETRAAVARIALVGMPNTGKTTLFNRFTGLRHRTGNFPGTTVEARRGLVRAPAGGAGKGGTVLGLLSSRGGDCCGPGDGAPPERAASASEEAREIVDALEVIDLPGVYSLELDQIEAGIVRGVLEGRTAFKGEGAAAPDALCVVLDATNLSRNLMLAGEALRRRLPTVVAVNMIDLAGKQGLHVDGAKLAALLGCEVVMVNARSGEGVDRLFARLGEVARAGVVPTRTPPGGERLSAEEQALRRWADEVFAGACSARGGGEGASSDTAGGGEREVYRESGTDRLDRVLTHPLWGTVVFAVVMTGLFFSIFALAQYPMAWLDAIFVHLGAAADWTMGLVGLREGFIHDLIKDGVIAGVGATVMFLPQICLLFLLINLLEDTGYLARAALLMDRVLRPFGLPGHAFVPLLSSHACALPGIMATRCIPDPRQRLATILVAPFMTCSARLPVYVLLTGMLFPGRPLLAALAFVGCYGLGMAAGVLSALLARRTILRGAARAMALELPSYKRPSVRSALIMTYDRAVVFLKKAGTMIVAVSIVLWWLGSFPKVEAPAEAEALRAAAERVRAGEVGAWPLNLKTTDEWAALPEGERRAAQADALVQEAEALTAQHSKRASFIGRLGRAAEPVFAPIGADWQLSVGVLASFAAREVFTSTMGVIVTGSEDAEDEGVRARLQEATRDDGTRLFNAPASWALLVFYVLAMQCLATLVVTAREAGHWKWAVLQLAWMSGLAYASAALVYQAARAVGAG